MIYAPIALFVYNRPRHTRQTVEALLRNRLAADSKVCIFSDAAKNAEAAAAVTEVRRYIRTITGFASIEIVERSGNTGLAASIIAGVTRLCAEYGRVIVLEDDLITSPGFLEYMNQALDRYALDDQVMQIAGYMFPVELDIADDALFMPFISSWGWATWSRAWGHFDADATGFQQLSSDAETIKRFDLFGRYPYFKMLQAQQVGKVESWAIRWYLSVFQRNGLALYPKRTFVHNDGFDGSGVNCAVSKFEQDELHAEFRVSRFPNVIVESPSARDVMKNMPVPKLNFSSLVKRLVGILGRR